jgi:phosphatidylserine decarboxylase
MIWLLKRLTTRVTMKSDRKARLKKALSIAFFVMAIAMICAILVLLKFAAATDYMYHVMVKDPERRVPQGPVIVSPADGTIIYIKKVTSGKIPEVVKKGVAVPVEEHMKINPSRPFKDGYLIGIFMNTQGVHINRVPDNGIIRGRFIFNGPQVLMTETEKEIILTQLIPGLLSMRKVLGLSPFTLRGKAEYILKSARETMVIEGDRGTRMFVVRIADYYVGKILTWVTTGSRVARGQKLGMIAWGSQTDLFLESSPFLTIKVHVGDYIYGGETVLATY